jgi:hypothetical protein
VVDASVVLIPEHKTSIVAKYQVGELLLRFLFRGIDLNAEPWKNLNVAKFDISSVTLR